MEIKKTLSCCLAVISLLGITPLTYANCPVPTLEADAVPDAPPSRGRSLWYGSNGLSALLPPGARWRGMGADRRYRDKFWWWSEHFNDSIEALPLVAVSAHLQGNPAIKAKISKGANSMSKNWLAMLVIAEFPRPGCWQVTGEYKGEKLSFVLEVGL